MYARLLEVEPVTLHCNTVVISKRYSCKSTAAHQFFLNYILVIQFDVMNQHITGMAAKVSIKNPESYLSLFKFVVKLIHGIKGLIVHDKIS